MNLKDFILEKLDRREATRGDVVSTNTVRAWIEAYESENRQAEYLTADRTGRWVSGEGSGQQIQRPEAENLQPKSPKHRSSLVTLVRSTLAAMSATERSISKVARAMGAHPQPEYLTAEEAEPVRWPSPRPFKVCDIVHCKRNCAFGVVSSLVGGSGRHPLVVTFPDAKRGYYSIFYTTDGRWYHKDTEPSLTHAPE